MLRLLRKFFGPEGTLKRETVIVIWAWITFIIVRLYAFTDPSLVHNFNDVTSTVLWCLVLLLAAIFGIQVVPNIGALAGKTETTKISTPDATLETKSEQTTQAS